MDLKDLLSTLVSHDSVFGNEKSLAEWVVWYLSKLGFQVNKQPVDKNRFNVLAKKAGGSNLLCYGHLDTVPVYNGWGTDPFSLTAKGDRLYGLGSCDMKGGIAAMLYAIQNLGASDPVTVFFAVDEENASEGAWHLVNKETAWLKGITHMLSSEPGASANKIGGSDVLTLGRRGRVRFIIKINGFSAHGGHVDRGVSAISIAARIISEVEAIEPAYHERLGQGSHYVARISAASEGLSIPEYCEIEIERHLVLPETTESCLDEYRAVCDKVLSKIRIPKGLRSFVGIDVGIKKRRNAYMEPYEIPSNDKLVILAKEIIEKKRAAIINYGRSVGDENVFANKAGIRPLIIGPEGRNIHSPNEWISEKSLAECAAIYEQIIRRFK